MNVIEAHCLGKRYYGRIWALRDCTVAVPEGHVVALVGPNGAGKTTLLNLAAGLTAPSTGEITVLGGESPGSPRALDGIGFVAQDMPLYRSLSTADLLHMTRNLNRHFDRAYAERRLRELGIPLAWKAGRLSGGQRAQLALTLTLARRPRLLLLDEPMAMLDPLARHAFMAALMAAVAEDGVSVVLSSHVLSELERVADYLVLLSRGRVQVAGRVDDLLASHRLLSAPTADLDRRAGHLNVVQIHRGASQTQVLVRTNGTADGHPADWESSPVGLEELTLAYLSEPGRSALPGPEPATHGREAELTR